MIPVMVITGFTVAHLHDRIWMMVIPVIVILFVFAGAVIASLVSGAVKG